MCGIVGILNYGNSRHPASPSLLGMLADTMRHRGPDGAGVWVSQDKKIGLGHRRLGIIDLSQNAQQPISNEAGDVWLTYNGEIYNYATIRTRLKNGGQHRFRSRSDTEVIVHLYEDKEEECLSDLDGMFAFGLWDDRRKRLFLARDRLGIKPLYYGKFNGVFLFASEIKAILAHPIVSAEMNNEALLQYLSLRATPAPDTLFKGIYKLPPGYLLTCDVEGNISIESYWDAASAYEHDSGRSHDPRGSVNIVRELLRSAVDKRTVSDVPVGAFLSGGLDSTAIVAFMSRDLGTRLSTFSISVDDVANCSEGEHARYVAKHFNTDHHELCIRREQVEEYLPELAYSLDEPIADPVAVPLYYLSKAVNAAGIKVVETGEGSDELFLGYSSRLHALQAFERKKSILSRVPTRMLPGLAMGLNMAGAFSGRINRLSRAVSDFRHRRPPFFQVTAFAREELIAWFVDRSMWPADKTAEFAIETIHSRLMHTSPQADIGTQVSYIDLKLRLAELLLMRTDKITMSVGLEARVPFLDYRLVEYVISLPLSFKVPGWNPKQLLKAALKGIVPDRIIERPKQIFSSPVNIWLRQGMQRFAEDLFSSSRLFQAGFFREGMWKQLLREHVASKRDYGAELWTLMVLCAWYDRWIEQPNTGHCGNPMTASAVRIPN